MTTPPESDATNLPDLLAALSADEGNALDRLHARLVAAAAAEGVLDIGYRTVDTPVGTLLLAATEQGLLRVAYPSQDHDAVLAALGRAVSPRILHAPARLDEVSRQLEQYFAGRRTGFELPLDLRLSTGIRLDLLHWWRQDFLRAIRIVFTRRVLLLGHFCPIVETGQFIRASHKLLFVYADKLPTLIAQGRRHYERLHEILLIALANRREGTFHLKSIRVFVLAGLVYPCPVWQPTPRHLDDADTMQSLDDQAHRPIWLLEDLVHGREGPDPMQIRLLWILRRGVPLGKDPDQAVPPDHVF